MTTPTRVRQAPGELDLGEIRPGEAMVIWCWTSTSPAYGAAAEAEVRLTHQEGVGSVVVHHPATGLALLMHRYRLWIPPVAFVLFVGAIGIAVGLAGRLLEVRRRGTRPEEIFTSEIKTSVTAKEDIRLWEDSPPTEKINYGRFRPACAVVRVKNEGTTTIRDLVAHVSYPAAEGGDPVDGFWSASPGRLFALNGPPERDPHRAPRLPTPSCRDWLPRNQKMGEGQPPEHAAAPCGGGFWAAFP